MEDTIETTETPVVETKKVKIKNTTPNIGKFYKSRERVVVSQGTNYNKGRNAIKRARKQHKG